MNLPTGAKFHESLASNWSASYESGGFRRRIVFFERLLKKYVQPNELWLDVGCGSGILARKISLLGAQVIAIDGSPKMIECAKNESLDRNNNISYELVESIEALEFKELCFDNVLCSSVIEYLEEPEKTLGELFRVIRYGGKLIVSVPNKLSVIRRGIKLIRMYCKIFGKDVYPYMSVSINEYSSDSITNQLRKVGFVVDTIQIFDPMLPNIISRFTLGSLFVITAHKPHEERH